MSTIFDRFAAGLDIGAGPPPRTVAEAQDAMPELTVLRAAGSAVGLPVVDQLDGRTPDPDFLRTIPISFARRHTLLGLSGPDGRLIVALAGVEQMAQLDTLAKLLGRPVEPLLAPASSIRKALNAAYQLQTGQVEEVIEGLDEQTAGSDREAAVREDLLDVASRAPVVKLVNLMLFEAVRRRASDMHIQPWEDRLAVRIRVDGVLHDVFEPPKILQEEIISRIKVMAGMNIAERRMAQDGRATVEVGDRMVDLRVATMPSSFGERVAIRLLDKSSRLYRLDDLAMPPFVLDNFRKLIRRDHGIILVTGPTGSGKSTTLYAALQAINHQELNILTLEDPIEYRLEGISQTQISECKGMSFAGGLRHVLRQDPDAIMVGEIRDTETAHMAIQSALTGHLVFSTLHTNDAAGAVARMLDLGVEPYLLASSLLAVLAQRLLRRICPQCRQPYSPTAGDFDNWGMTPQTAGQYRFFHGVGCPECMNTGYRDRMGVFELLVINEPIREQVLQRSKASSIKSLATADGMQSLYDDGLEKACRGLTTMSEVIRVTGAREF